MCDVCTRIKKELVATKKQLTALTEGRDRDNPINIDMVKTAKSMSYERIREIMKKSSENS
jgi:hypothetical protein